MDWIFDNLQFLLIVAGAVAYWLNQRHEARKQAEAERNRPVELPEFEGEPRPEPESLPEAMRRLLAELEIDEAKPLPPPPPPPVVVATLPPPIPSAPAPAAPSPALRPSLLAPTRAARRRRLKSLRTSLQTPSRIQEAILLQEILGQPVGLRPPRAETARG